MISGIFLGQYTTRKCFITILYHAIENTVPNTINATYAQTSFVLSMISTTLLNVYELKIVFGTFLLLKFFPFSLQNFAMFGKFAAFNQRVFILNFGENKIVLHDGKVGCDTVEYTTAFLYSDWLYFPWHGINFNTTCHVILRIQLSLH